MASSHAAAGIARGTSSRASRSFFTPPSVSPVGGPAAWFAAQRTASTSSSAGGVVSIDGSGTPRGAAVAAAASGGPSSVVDASSTADASSGDAGGTAVAVAASADAAQDADDPATVDRRSRSPDAGTPAPGGGPADGAGDDRWDARIWGALIVLCGALFLDGLDVSMVGVALPSIGSDLGLSAGTLQWVVSGYVLGYGGLLLLGGRAADLLGRRRVFLIALGVFAVASLLGALVDDGTLLIATRFIKGVAAAFTAPAGLSIITTTFREGPARNRALSIYAACGASGFSLGLVFGGVLTEAGWRYTFLLPAPIAIALLIAARRFIAKDEPDDAGHRSYDLAGAATVTGSMLLLVYAVVEAPGRGWLDPVTLAAFAVSAGLLAAFVAIERRVQHPLVRLGVFRSRHIVHANIGAMVVFGSYVGFQFLATLYLQDALDWSPLQTALAFLPAGLLVAFGAPRTGALVDRIGTAPVILVGLTAFAVGYALFFRADATPTYATTILPTMLLLGVGFALCFPALNMQATAGIEDHEQGLASGLVNTSFQVGGAVVLALVTAVVSANAVPGDQAAGIIDALRPATGLVMGVAILGVLVTAAVLAPGARRTVRARVTVRGGAAD
ncbi:MFS transporter [Patulibacter minatonensis]|uniref:MFS transporter n=1 Tax=Patulibacter minatonensis TaxID=298163 RepID=UPI0004BB82D6|nr:MFS transporter [Patulibacter minatonensis]